MRRLLFTIAFVMLCGYGVRAALAEDVVVIRAARLLDVETGKLISPAVVVVKRERIEGVGAAAAPLEARVIELGDVTVLPGLIDAHTHLTLDLYEKDWLLRQVTEGGPDMTLRGARNARLTLAAGFTTVRDLGSYYFADTALARAIDAGWVEGPRMIPCGYGIGITGGHADYTGFTPGILEVGPKQGIADGVADLLEAVRYQMKHGARVIKICATAGIMSFEGSYSSQQLSDEELRTVVEEAKRQGVKVATHAYGPEGTLAAVRAGVSSIEHGVGVSDETLALMEQKGIYLVPTAYTFSGGVGYDVLPPEVLAKAKAVDAAAQESHRRAFRSRVKIAFGTDAGNFPHGQSAREFVTLVEWGMRPLDAIRAATLNAADLLGVSDRGVIAPGKLADIIAVPGNPLEDVKRLQQVCFVMKGGMVVKSAVP
jgi:imidazolonepropionase-like amidohydrolase